MDIVALEVSLQEEVSDLVMRIAFLSELVVGTLLLEEFVMLQALILLPEESAVKIHTVRGYTPGHGWRRVNVHCLVLEGLKLLLELLVDIHVRIWPFI